MNFQIRLHSSVQILKLASVFFWDYHTFHSGSLGLKQCILQNQNDAFECQLLAGTSFETHSWIFLYMDSTICNLKHFSNWIYMYLLVKTLLNIHQMILNSNMKQYFINKSLKIETEFKYYIIF